MSQYGPGWRFDLEDFDYLERTSTPLLYSAGEIQPSVSMRAAGLKIENQGRFSSCVGHALSSALECCNWLETRQWEQLSRWWCYITAQMATGMQGRDNGATIAGAAKAAKERGVCLEKTFPYPQFYTDRLPQSAAAEAAEHKVKSWRFAADHNEVNHFIGSGFGFGILGIDWRRGLADSRNGEMSERTFVGPSAGGHALMASGYFRNGDSEIANSHTPNWGDKGFGRMSKGLMDMCCKQRQVVLISDLEAFERPRDFGGMA